MKSHAEVKTGPWVTVVENIAHPDHAGVTGDLCRNRDTGKYQLLEYNPVADNYTPYSVPHKWAVKHDPTTA
jgi:hypothetical protein